LRIQQRTQLCEEYARALLSFGFDVNKETSPTFLCTASEPKRINVSFQVIV